MKNLKTFCNGKWKFFVIISKFLEKSNCKFFLWYPYIVNRIIFKRDVPKVWWSASIVVSFSKLLQIIKLFWRTGSFQRSKAPVLWVFWALLATPIWPFSACSLRKNSLCYIQISRFKIFLNFSMAQRTGTWVKFFKRKQARYLQKTFALYISFKKSES